MCPCVHRVGSEAHARGGAAAGCPRVPLPSCALDAANKTPRCFARRPPLFGAQLLAWPAAALTFEPTRREMLLMLLLHALLMGDIMLERGQGGVTPHASRLTATAVKPKRTH